MVDLYSPGDIVVFRNHHPTLGVERGSVSRVVEDTNERTIIYISSGSGYKQVVWMGNAPPRPDQVGKFEEKNWSNYSMIRIMYPGVPYSIWPMWRATTGEFVRWYVNIESPFERTRFGFTVVDYELDIVVNPDMTWSWKDEEELEGLVRKEIFTEAQAVDFKNYGLDAVKRIEQCAAPFNEPWPDWRPDPSWGPLEMPTDQRWLDISKD